MRKKGAEIKAISLNSRRRNTAKYVDSRNLLLQRLRIPGLLHPEPAELIHLIHLDKRYFDHIGHHAGCAILTNPQRFVPILMIQLQHERNYWGIYLILHHRNSIGRREDIHLLFVGDLGLTGLLVPPQACVICAGLTERA